MRLVSAKRYRHRSPPRPPHAPWLAGQKRQCVGGGDWYSRQCVGGGIPLETTKLHYFSCCTGNVPASVRRGRVRWEMRQITVYFAAQTSSYGIRHHSQCDLGIKRLDKQGHGLIRRDCSRDTYLPLCSVRHHAERAPDLHADQENVTPAYGAAELVRRVSVLIRAWHGSQK